MPKPVYVLDTSQLSILCRFPLKGTPFIYEITPVVTILIPESVIIEARKATSTIAQVASPLVKQGIIESRPAPLTPKILDEYYGDELGEGERGVIRLSIATGLPCVLDDKDAFIVACRFGLRPLMFQDFVVRLVNEHGMKRETGITVVMATARLFPSMFIAHTLHMLNEGVT